MRALIVYGLLSIMLGNVLTSIAAAEKIETTVPTVQAAKKIILESNDSQRFTFPKEVAELSMTIKNLIEDVPQSAQGDYIIPLSEITGYTLSRLKLLMELANSLQNAPFTDRLNALTASINTLPAAYELPTWENLLHIIDDLDIEILKAPLANGMMRLISTIHAGDRELIEAIILSLHISDEFKGLLAKYWYLNYGTNKNYILPDLDYGFSIEELATFNKLPQIITGEETGYKILNLATLRINDLTGLNSIPAIESIGVLYLDDNWLTTLPLDIFDKLNNLQSLGLSDNQLSTLPLGIFDKLNNLLSLNLSGNRLTTLPKDVFDKLNNLKSLYLSYNQLATVPLGIFDKLNNLQSLGLSDNQLSTLPLGIFGKLNNLQSLDLSGNQLTTLPLGILDKLNNLQRINLYGNQLTTLPLGIFDKLNNLRNLYLYGNPLAVDQRDALQKKLGNKVQF